MRYYHCEWCRATAPENKAEGWAHISSLDDDGYLYTYCPDCKVNMKCILGNRPEYVQKLVKMTVCMDDLLDAVDRWNVRTANQFNPANCYMLDPNQELRLEYGRILDRYREAVQNLVEEEEDDEEDYEE